MINYYHWWTTTSNCQTAKPLANCSFSQLLDYKMTTSQIIIQISTWWLCSLVNKPLINLASARRTSAENNWSNPNRKSQNIISVLYLILDPFLPRDTNDQNGWKLISFCRKLHIRLLLENNEKEITQLTRTDFLKH